MTSRCCCIRMCSRTYSLLMAVARAGTACSPGGLRAWLTMAEGQQDRAKHSMLHSRTLWHHECNKLKIHADGSCGLMQGWYS